MYIESLVINKIGKGKGLEAIDVSISSVMLIFLWIQLKNWVIE
jgi:hypothetical protein